jgi:hypothetical protein
MVSPAGIGISRSWHALVGGSCEPYTHASTFQSDLLSRPHVVARVPRPSTETTARDEHDMSAHDDTWRDYKIQGNYWPTVIGFGVDAAHQALLDAALVSGSCDAIAPDLSHVAVCHSLAAQPTCQPSRDALQH